MNDIQVETGWLGALLSATSKRHQAVSANLANAGTPGYRPVRVKFEELLGEMISGDGKVDFEKVAGLRAEIARDAATDSVAIEEELMTLMRNQLAYDTYSQVISMKFNLLRSALRNGRG